MSGKTLYLSFSGAFLICAVLSLTKYFGINTAQSHGSCTFGWKDSPAVQTYITRKREVPVTCDASVVSIRKSCRNKWTLKKYSVINSNVCLIVLFYTNGMGIKCDPLTVML